VGLEKDGEDPLDRSCEEVLYRVKEDTYILHTVKRRKANWIGHILRWNCLLKHVIEGNIEGKSRRGRRRKQLTDDLKEKIGYWNLKEEALDRTLQENLLWKELWTCRKTDYAMIEFVTLRNVDLKVDSTR
jgi:hypothetical protein